MERESFENAVDIRFPNGDHDRIFYDQRLLAIGAT